MLPTKFRVNGPFGSEEAKNRFSRWAAMAAILDFQSEDFIYLFFISIFIYLFIYFFDLQVTPMLPNKFRVNCPFGSGEEAKNRFSRWPHLDFR